MGLSEDELMEMDFQDLSDSDIAVLFALGDGAVHRTRLQKVLLLFEEIFGKGERPAGYSAYFYGGYSDDVEESASALTSAGILYETREGYVLSEYGRKLRDHAGKVIRESGSKDRKAIVEGVPRIVQSISDVPDRYVVGLTYHFYSDTASRSTIRESVDRLNGSASYDGRRLKDMSREEFEDRLRNGIAIHLDRAGTWSETMRSRMRHMHRRNPTIRSRRTWN